jgi:hypothetical protein
MCDNPSSNNYQVPSLCQLNICENSDTVRSDPLSLLSIGLFASHIGFEAGTLCLALYFTTGYRISIFRASIDSVCYKLNGSILLLLSLRDLSLVHALLCQCVHYLQLDNCAVWYQSVSQIVGS